MKLFSRKAIVAGATALAVTFAGTSVAVAQEDETTVTTTTDETSVETPTSKESEAPAEGDKEEGSSTDPKDITAWISVFTAVVGAVGTLFTFANKHFDFMG
ncbi:hypothetical protein [Corynebacterium casei]|uniref:hypothetical protein n=1 Tax=Corynebacterium casei TaxID=160386 RepID=UPI003F9758D8